MFLINSHEKHTWTFFWFLHEQSSTTSVLKGEERRDKRSGGGKGRIGRKERRVEKERRVGEMRRGRRGEEGRGGGEVRGGEDGKERGDGRR